MKSVTVLSTFLLTSWTASALAADIKPDETDARKIMTAVIKRDNGDKMTARLKMSVKDSSGSERNRIARSFELDFESGTKRVFMFEDPSDVRNTGFLSVDYDDGKKDDDQFLYLPNLKKTSRIASSAKSGSFMGTDFTYADMTDPDPADYEYKILKQSTKVAGEECWLIAARPVSAKAKEETGYIDSQNWVSKSKLMTVQLKARVRAGKKLKYMKWADIKNVNGVWRSHLLTARIVRNKEVQSESTILYMDLKLGQETVNADIFTQRFLEAGI